MARPYRFSDEDEYVDQWEEVVDVPRPRVPAPVLHPGTPRAVGTTLYDPRRSGGGPGSVARPGTEGGEVIPEPTYTYVPPSGDNPDGWNHEEDGFHPLLSTPPPPAGGNLGPGVDSRDGTTTRPAGVGAGGNLGPGVDNGDGTTTRPGPGVRALPPPGEGGPGAGGAQDPGDPGDPGPNPGMPDRPDLAGVYSMEPAYFRGVKSGQTNPNTLNYFLREQIRRGELLNRYDPSKRPVDLPPVEAWPTSPPGGEPTTSA